MGKGLIAFLVAIGGGTWIYNKFMKYTGNITQRAVIAAVASGIVIFFAMFIVLGVIGF
jgi:hypothetical protein